MFRDFCLKSPFIELRFAIPRCGASESGEIKQAAQRETNDSDESMPSSDESIWSDLIQRARHEPLAVDELLERTNQRLEHLARRMLRNFPRVRRWEETNDVLQEALLRLNRAMRDSPPNDLSHFFRLATLQMRRTLLDLVKRHQGPLGLATNHESDAAFVLRNFPCRDAVDDKDGSSLDDWTALHEAVERLRSNEQDVFQLLWYHELTQTEAAEVLGIDERTVRRRWTAARLSLMKLIGANAAGGVE